MPERKLYPLRTPPENDAEKPIDIKPYSCLTDEQISQQKEALGIVAVVQQLFCGNAEPVCFDTTQQDAIWLMLEHARCALYQSQNPIALID